MQIPLMHWICGGMIRICESIPNDRGEWAFSVGSLKIVNMLQPPCGFVAYAVWKFRWRAWSAKTLYNFFFVFFYAVKLLCFNQKSKPNWLLYLAFVEHVGVCSKCFCKVYMLLCALTCLWPLTFDICCSQNGT